METVSEVSTLYRAGLQAGDVMLTWTRTAAPPANPEPASGVFRSYFDWLDLVAEQAPRGTVVLTGRRGTKPIVLTVKPGLWTAQVRPELPAELESSYARGEIFLEGGDLESAWSAWELLLSDARFEENGGWRAWFLLRTGDIWAQLENLEFAAKSYLYLLRRTTDPREKIEASHALGELNLLLGRLDRAEVMIEAAISLENALNPESLKGTEFLSRLGWISILREKRHKGRDHFQRALRLRRRLAPQSLLVAASLSYLANIAGVNGELDVGLDLAAEALRIHQHLAPGSLEVAESLRVLGFYLADGGELGRAQGYASQAMELFQRFARESRSVARTWSLFARIANLRGDPDRSYHYNLRALQVTESLAPGSLEVAGRLAQLGKVAEERGQLDLADDYHHQVFELCRRIAPKSHSMAGALKNLGDVAAARGDWDRSHGYYLEASALSESIAPGSAAVAVSFRDLGKVAAKRGELERAYRYYLRGQNIIEKFAPNSLFVADSLANLGKISADLGKLNRSREYHLRALDLYRRFAPKITSTAKIQNDIGKIALASGDLEVAHESFTRSLEAFENQLSRLGGSYDSQIGFRARNSIFYRDLMDVLHTLGRDDEAFHVLERSKARTLLKMLTERKVRLPSEVPEALKKERRQLANQFDLTQQELRNLRLPRDQDTVEDIHYRLDQLRWKADEIEEKVRRSSPRLAALQYPEPLTTDDARQRLDQGTALVSFSVGRKSTYVFVLRQGEELQVHKVCLEEGTLRKKIENFRAALDAGRTPGLSTESSKNLGRELYRDLLLAVEPWLAGADRILLIPDGPLHLLPFAALLRETAANDSPEPNEQYLIEWKPLHFSASTTVYAKLLEDRHSKKVPIEEDTALELAAFGDPDFGDGSFFERDSPDDPQAGSAIERGLFNWEPLVFSRREVEGIVKLFPQSARAYLGEEATEEQIKALGSRPKILHIATHGYYDDRMPLSSAVVLSLPEGSPEGRDNGLLQAWEIIEQLYLDADLVVLSACDTGRGKLREGEGLISLSRAFQVAGARTVIASQWSADDMATAELMVAFYRHLRAGQSKDEALRSAQIELIRAQKECTGRGGEPRLVDTYTPYHWALFQVIGDYQ